MLPDKTSSVGSRPIWFAVKRYGWGWGLPVAWQGWVVLILWIVIVLFGGAILAVHSWIGYAVFMAVMAGLLVSICCAKGEAPQWRWGSS
jgi:hypothetical protein